MDTHLALVASPDRKDKCSSEPSWQHSHVAGSEAPISAVSGATVLIGLASLLVSLLLILNLSLDPAWSSWLVLLGTALPMAAWSLVVEKVHMRESTGLDFGLVRPWDEVLPITLTKTFGLAVTFALLALGYFCFKTYSEPRYADYLKSLKLVLPCILLAAPVYIAFTTRHMVSPKDGLWHFGRLACLRLEEVNSEEVKDYLRGWLVKGFFIAFMAPALSISVGDFVKNTAILVNGSTVEVLNTLVSITFLADIYFGTIGYIFAIRLLDTHIRTTNPFMTAWVAALVCYPPFIIVSPEGPLNYFEGTLLWVNWLADLPLLQFAWGIAILALAIIYAWATVCFGLRFSNLTHRGIITNGPYRHFKHPAYLSKNLMWWLMYLPFLSTTGLEDAVRNSLLLLGVNAIYYARAKTEERHLFSDPAYKEYSDWIARSGLIERLSIRLLENMKMRTPESSKPVLLTEPAPIPSGGSEHATPSVRQ